MFVVAMKAVIGVQLWVSPDVFEVNDRFGRNRGSGRILIVGRCGCCEGASI